MTSRVLNQGGERWHVSLDEFPARAPDRRWTRRDWRVVECWILDYGRPFGAEVLWRLAGEPRSPIWFRSPEHATEELSRWEARDVARTLPRDLHDLICPTCLQFYDPTQHALHQRLCPGPQTTTVKATDR